jgi:hypothetical protein
VYDLSTLGSREIMSSCSNQIITDFKPRLGLAVISYRVG